MLKPMLAAALSLFAVACSGPKECKEAKPAMEATAAALKSNNFAAAKTAAQTLAKAVENTQKDLGILELRTGELISALDQASTAPASPEQGAKDAEKLKTAISTWTTAADKVRGICK